MDRWFDNLNGVEVGMVDRRHFVDLILIELKREYMIINKSTLVRSKKGGVDS